MKFVYFLKSRLIFNIFFCLYLFCLYISFLHILSAWRKNNCLGKKVSSVELEVNENDSEELEGDDSLEGETFKPEVCGSDLHENMPIYEG